jgi:type 1 fimbria pilin
MLKIGLSIVFCLLQLTVGVSVAFGETVPCTIAAGLNFAPAVANNLFPRDAPIGTESPPYTTIVQVDCIADTIAVQRQFFVYAPNGVNVPGSIYNFQTDVSNVAVRYDVENGPSTSCSPYSEGWPSHIKQSSRTINCKVAASAQPISQRFNLKVSAYFLKTGNGTSGNLTAIPSVVFNEYVPVVGPVLNIFSGAATGTFSVAACTVTTTSIAVTMPKTYTYRLPKVGSTDGETSLNIGLNCDPGVKVYTTLTDVSTPTNQTTTLSLSPDSTAQGLGYQILFNGTPLTFGPDSAVVKNIGQFMMTPAQTTGGTLTVPLSARYIRTGKINSGSANAKATFTMSYQ